MELFSIRIQRTFQLVSTHDIVNLCHCDMYFYIFIGGFFFSASIIMHSTVFRISVSHYHRGNSRFQREKDF